MIPGEIQLNRNEDFFLEITMISAEKKAKSETKSK